MTYNFDPERWYDNEQAYLRHRYRVGKISKEDYAQALKTLEKKLEEMWGRVDGTYQIHQRERQT